MLLISFVRYLSLVAELICVKLNITKKISINRKTHKREVIKGYLEMCPGNDFGRTCSRYQRDVMLLLLSKKQTDRGIICVR